MKLLIALLFQFSLCVVAAPINAKTVCTAGDSITANARYLRTLLYNANSDWQYVGNYYDGRWFHDGIPGDTSAGLVSRLDTLPPCDIALVLIGTNDLNYLLTLDASIRSIQRIVTTLSERGTAVHLMTILPRIDSLEHNLWNTWINGRIKTEITNATIHNTYWAMMNSETSLIYLLPDRIHPGAAGYEVIFEYINPRL